MRQNWTDATSIGPVLAQLRYVYRVYQTCIHLLSIGTSVYFVSKYDELHSGKCLKNNVDLLWIVSLGTKSSHIQIRYHDVSSIKIYLKMSSVKQSGLCLDCNVSFRCMCSLESKAYWILHNASYRTPFRPGKLQPYKHDCAVIETILQRVVYPRKFMLNNIYVMFQRFESRQGNINQNWACQCMINYHWFFPLTMNSWYSNIKWIQQHIHNTLATMLFLTMLCLWYGYAGFTLLSIFHMFVVLVLWKYFDFDVICEVIVALVKLVEISTRLVLGSEACWVKSREISTQFAFYNVLLWASYQIREIAGCACAGNAGNIFPRRRFQRKSLASDPGMHHGTCLTHVP